MSISLAEYNSFTIDSVSSTLQNEPYTVEDAWVQIFLSYMSSRQLYLLKRKINADYFLRMKNFLEILIHNRKQISLECLE